MGDRIDREPVGVAGDLIHRLWFQPFNGDFDSWRVDARFRRLLHHNERKGREGRKETTFKAGIEDERECSPAPPASYEHDSVCDPAAFAAFCVSSWAVKAPAA